MKTTITSLLIALLISTQALASGVQLKFDLRSKYVDGFGTITIMQASKGQLKIAHDKNRCFVGEGLNRLCTKMAVILETVTPVVVEDNRPLDGDLILKLNDRLQLSIGSGFNIEEKVYAHVIDTETGSRVEVVPNLVWADLKK